MTLGYRPTWTDPYRWMFTPDIHWGYELEGGRKKPLHNRKAINVMLEFARDYRPHGFILGGDQLDLGAISHWNKTRKLGMEGLRIQQDIDEFGSQVMAPIEEVTLHDQVWLNGNHERFMEDLVEYEPGLADTLNIPRMLNLENREWKFIPTGGHLDLGKLRFVHGDQLGGGDAVAKAAILEHNHSIAFGHFHTAQSYVKHSPVDSTDIHVGIAVPCLANRGPGYMKKRANKWANGFLFGATFPDGSFTYYMPLIVNGRLYANGRTYTG